MNQKHIDIILIFLISILILVIVYMIFQFDKNAYECLGDPISHYENLKNLSCSCTQKPFSGDINFSELLKG